MPRAPTRLALAAALAAATPASAAAAPWAMPLRAGPSGPVPAALSAGPLAYRPPVLAAPARDPDSRAARPLGDPDRLLRDAEDAIAAAEKAAADKPPRTDAELAERLVEGQYFLKAGDGESAAIAFLDLIETAPESGAASQARFYLGEALLLLDMRRWASECFSRTLADPGAEARRLHQRAVARLLELAAPARPRGHARKFGPSILPELRARLQAASDRPDRPPTSELSAVDVSRLRGWVAAVPPDQRLPELRYAWGRYLFLAREYTDALAELDGLVPPDMPFSTGDRAWQLRLRATYLAGAALAALGRVDDALARFDRILVTRSLPGADEQEIRELAWLARARVLHDRGDYDGALQAYRAIGRASPLYPNALYEIAWTLLRADRYDAALAALEQLLRETPDSPAAPEAKALRGKLQIRRRAWKAAEEQFAALRRDFDQQLKALAPALAVQADALAHTRALVSADPRHFSLDVLVPRAAIPIARNLPRAVQAERLARETGEVDRLLHDTLALLGRMELAAASPERANLFTDLGAHWRSLDLAARDLGEAGEALLARAGRPPSGERAELRRQLDLLFDRPSKQVRRLADLGDQLRAAEAEAGQLRGKLIGLETMHRESGKRRAPDPFFQEAAALQAELGALDRSIADLHRRMQVARATQRFTDPLPKARRDALAAHNALVGQSWPGGGDKDLAASWQRRQKLLVRLDAARKRIDRAAAARLARALVVLREERDNLTRYRLELDSLRPRAEATAAEAAHAAVRDVAADLRYWTIRADVGLLDVAWATKEAELEEARALERTRERSTRELDRAIEHVLEDSE